MAFRGFRGRGAEAWMFTYVDVDVYVHPRRGDHPPAMRGDNA